MIKPLLKDINRGLLRCVYDIETDSCGYLLQIGFVVGDSEEVQFVSEFSQMLRVLIDAYKMGEYKGIQLWAHNGFRFDHMYLMYALAGRGELEMINGIFDGGQIMALDIKLRGVKVYLQDSFSLFQSSLAKITASFNTKYVKRTELVADKTPEELWRESPTLFFDYLRYDVLSLKESLDNLASLLSESEPLITELPSTVGSLAMKIFRANLTESIMTSGRKLDNFERSSYFGGLCDCLQVGEFDRVVGIDVNSMYPNQLCDHQYPLSYVGIWVSGMDFDWCELGLWHITYDTHPYRFIYECDTRKLSAVGHAIVDTNTVRYLKKHYTVRVNYGYVYKQTSHTLFNYLKKYYEWKCEGGAKGLFAKFVLNSTYGKFGQKHTKSVITQLTLEQMRDMINAGQVFHEYCLNNEFQFHTYNKEGVSPNTFVAIASLVTLRSRLVLHDTIRRMNNDGHKVIYFDTDSVHFVPSGKTEYEQLVEIHDSKLGAWKIQFDGKAGYAGKKLYYYYDENGKPVVKAKGVSQLSVQEIQAIINDNVVIGTYLTCATPREVLFKGKRPCVFSEKQRQLRLGDLNNV